MAGDVKKTDRMVQEDTILKEAKLNAGWVERANNFRIDKHDIRQYIPTEQTDHHEQGSAVYESSYMGSEAYADDSLRDSSQYYHTERKLFTMSEASDTFP